MSGKRFALRLVMSLLYAAGMAAGGWVAVKCAAPELGAVVTLVAWVTWMCHAQTWGEQ